MGEPQFTKHPDLRLSQRIFQITNPDSSAQLQDKARAQLVDGIKSNKMAPLYWYLTHPTSTPSVMSPGPDEKGQKQNMLGSVLFARSVPDTDTIVPWSKEIYDELLKDNKKELESIQEEEDKAVREDGEVEVMAARGKRAEFYARIGDKENAIKEFESMLESTGVVATKIDITMALVRVSMFYGNKKQVRKYIADAVALVESGGDWDRRNRLKAYEGLHLISVRSYSAAAPLLLDCMSTFTSYELCSYPSLVTYAVLAGVASLNRLEMKSRVIDSPDARGVVGNIEGRRSVETLGIEPPSPSAVIDELGDDAIPAEGNVEFMEKFSDKYKLIADLAGYLYWSDYANFFRALAAVEVNFLRRDRHLYEHRRWYVQEMRLRAYQQHLRSYNVVDAKAMASRFGVTPEYLKRDLSNFIASGRIHCKIDDEKNLIESSRSDDKSKQYQDMLRVGDQLITKLQKYGQSVRLRGSDQ